MKTSNKLLLAIGLIIMACLVGYNFALKNEYDKGDFRSPYYGMQKQNVGTFKSVENNAANLVGITILPGRTCLAYVNPDVSKNITFTNQGGKLRINYIGSGKERPSDGEVIILCPTLDSLVTNAFLNTDTKEGIERYQPYIKNEINHFDQPALKVRVGNYTRVDMDNNTLNQFYNVVGNDNSSNALLHIGYNNKIGHADFYIPGSNTLEVYSPFIANVTNHIANTASVLLNNGAFSIFTNPQNKSK